jgi:hypothetical protein
MRRGQLSGAMPRRRPHQPGMGPRAQEPPCSPSSATGARGSLAGRPAGGGPCRPRHLGSAGESTRPDPTGFPAPRRGRCIPEVSASSTPRQAPGRPPRRVRAVQAAARSEPPRRPRRAVKASTPGSHGAAPPWSSSPSGARRSGSPTMSLYNRIGRREVVCRGGGSGDWPTMPGDRGPRPWMATSRGIVAIRKPARSSMAMHEAPRGRSTWRLPPSLDRGRIWTCKCTRVRPGASAKCAGTSTDRMAPSP